MKIEGKTASGFEFSVESGLLEDFEFLTLLGDFTGDDDRARSRAVLAMPGRLLGEEGRRALIEHCRNEEGFSPTARIYEELGSILNLCQERNKAVKKS